MPVLTSVARDDVPGRDDDLVLPFMLESSGLRGKLVRLGPLLDEILSAHAYPDAVSQLVGEMLVLTPLLASALKYKGIFTLQTSSEGSMRTMVSDLTSEGALRAYAGFGADTLPAPGEDLLGRGYLAFTVDQEPGGERYQGIVELAEGDLAASLQHYFRQSEQIPTGLMAAVGRPAQSWRGGGLLLQSLPADLDPEGARRRREDSDHWRRAMILQASCTSQELLDPTLGAADLLYRLFHEEGVRVFRPRPLRVGCRCSRKRLEGILLSLPSDEIEAMIRDREIEVTCHFCSRRYRFDARDLAAQAAP